MDNSASAFPPCIPLTQTTPFNHVSNQERVAGKLSRAGGAAESEQLPSVYIPLTVYPGVGYLCVFGGHGVVVFFHRQKRKGKTIMSEANFRFAA
jgi:hypothetical protein